VVCLLGASAGAAEELFQMPAGIQPRWASAENPDGRKGAGATLENGRKGRPSLPLKAGASVVLAHADNTPGVVRRIWITIDQRDPAMLRGVKLEMTWDNSRTPAVSVPLGDFFGVGLGRMAKFQSALFADPEGRSFETFVPMPFRSAMKITLTNETDRDLAMVFYDVDYTIGDRIGPDSLYLHAWYHRENPTTLGQDYSILPLLRGRGRFLGVNVGLIVNQSEYLSSWWGEGEVKIYLDGDKEHPTLSGTGAEDYVGSAWGLGPFANAYTGCTVFKEPEICFYRWHIPDPIYFQSDIRVTWQQIGLWSAGLVAPIKAMGTKIYIGDPARSPDENDPKLKHYGLMERRDDVSSCAYFYLDRPEHDLPALPPVKERAAGLGE
jgi:hypothetical protein